MDHNETELREAVRRWTAHWVVPVSVEAPAGEECVYEDGFEAVDRELGKFGGLDRGAVDWVLVEAQASDLLIHRTKDLRLFTALCLALINTRGSWGLAAGLTAYRTVVERWWRQVYPRRDRARAGTLARLCHRLGSRTAADFCLLDINKPRPQELAALSLCSESLRGIRRSVAENSSLDTAALDFDQPLELLDFYAESLASAPRPDGSSADQGIDDAIRMFVRGPTDAGAGPGQR